MNRVVRRRTIPNQAPHAPLYLANDVHLVQNQQAATIFGCTGPKRPLHVALRVPPVRAKEAGAGDRVGRHVPVAGQLLGQGRLTHPRGSLQHQAAGYQGPVGGCRTKALEETQHHSNLPGQPGEGGFDQAGRRGVVLGQRHGGRRRLHRDKEAAVTMPVVEWWVDLRMGGCMEEEPRTRGGTCYRLSNLLPPRVFFGQKAFLGSAVSGVVGVVLFGCLLSGNAESFAISRAVSFYF